MRREKFEELLENFQTVRRSLHYSALLLYGTRGYGKSHLLAALVCYLVAQGERVVFIPDCRECLKSPVKCFKAAMLFAWADDHKEQEIMKLDEMKQILKFLQAKSGRGTIYVYDQLNGI